jgi:type IV pilus assembly protein PilV
MKKDLRRRFGANGGGGVECDNDTGQSGFSIIDVMIGICILSIGVLAVCSMQITGWKGNTTSYEYTMFSNIGMEQMEAFLAMPYDSLPDDTDGNGENGFFVADANADQVINDPGGQYTIYLNVAEDYLIDATKTISMILVWDNSRATRMTSWNGGEARGFISLQGVIPQII